MPDDVYSHGHHEAVLRSHRWRTAENSAAYLLDHLHPGLSLLDVGCGPGTLTVDLARRVAPAPVLGVDRASDVVAQAAAEVAAAGVDNVEVRVGDVYALDVAPASIHVAHAHQVLQHLSDPVAALRQLRGVLRPGGLLAVRDSDYAAFAWAPDDGRLARWMALYHDVTRRNGADADAGRYLPAWVAAAGFADVTVSSSTWTFATAQERAWWGALWADRVTASAFADQAVAYGLSDVAELATIAAAFRAWAAAPDGVFVVVHVEVLARA